MNFAILLHKSIDFGITTNQLRILKKYCQYDINEILQY